MFKIALTSLAALCAPVLALAGTASNTVPTSSLTATYQIAPANAGDTSGAIIVQLAKVSVVNGQAVTDNLDQSADDVVVFSNGTDTVTYNPSQAINAIPLVSGATYTATFTRGTGEKFTSAVAMPALVTFSAPTMNQVFAKNQAVNIDWNLVTAQQTMTMTSTNCSALDLSGMTFATSTTGNSATIPAGAANGCTSAAQVQFQPVYANVGTGYGLFIAATIGLAQFSYGTSAQPMNQVSLTGMDLAKMLSAAQQNPNHMIRIDQN